MREGREEQNREDLILGQLSNYSGDESPRLLGVLDCYSPSLVAIAIFIRSVVIIHKRPSRRGL